MLLECEWCGEEFISRNIKIHVNACLKNPDSLNNPKNLKCCAVPKCNNLVTNKRRKTCSRECAFKPAINCEFCDKIFSITRIIPHTKSCCKNPKNFRCCSAPECDKPAKRYMDTCSLECSKKIIIKCKFCKVYFTGLNISSHYRICHYNPDIPDRLKKYCANPECDNPIPRKSINTQITCSYECSRDYKVPCTFCDKSFSVKNMSTHTKSCSKNPNKILPISDYRSLCFLYHGKSCIVCGEKRVIEVHHMNKNRDDQTPDNIIPLCLNCHKCWHSDNHKNTVHPKIMEYLEKFRAWSKCDDGTWTIISNMT